MLHTTDISEPRFCFNIVPSARMSLKKVPLQQQTRGFFFNSCPFSVIDKNNSTWVSG